MTDEQKMRIEEFDDGEAPVPHDTLLDNCAKFLNTVLPGKNVISEAEAKRFLPLFNHTEFSKLSEEHIQALTTEYQMRFSMYHPLKVIASNVIDNSPEGVFWPADDKHHKLIAELPPVFKQVVDIGSLGGNASDLMTMFMNTTRNATPMNDRTNVVKDAIIEAIRRANDGTYTEEQKKQYAEKINAIEQGTVDKPKQTVEEDDADTGGMLWE